MIRMLPVIALLAVCVAPALPLFAQEHEEQPPQERQDRQNQPPEFGDPRFGFHHVEDGYLRLDMRTGDVAMCRQRAVGWACSLVPDERAAVDNELARLQRDNATLKNALLEHGVPLPNGMPPDAAPVPAAPAPQIAPPAVSPAVPPVASAPPAAPMPPKAGDPGRASRDDADIARLVDIIDRVWRRLVEMMADIQRDMQKKS
jgi:hypothetical protein